MRHLPPNRRVQVDRTGKDRLLSNAAVVLRGAGGSEEGDPSSARSVFRLSGSIPSVNTASETGGTRLPESSGHLPAGAGTHPPTGRTTGGHVLVKR